MYLKASEVMSALLSGKKIREKDMDRNSFIILKEGLIVDENNDEYELNFSEGVYEYELYDHCECEKTYSIIRTYSAGVFSGYVESKEYTVSGVQVVLKEARRLWYWSGAASLSQLAIDGTNNPESCKFSEALERDDIIGVIEIIPCTKKAEKSIKGVKIWKV